MRGVSGTFALARPGTPLTPRRWCACRTIPARSVSHTTIDAQTKRCIRASAAPHASAAQFERAPAPRGHAPALPHRARARRPHPTLRSRLHSSRIRCRLVRTPHLAAPEGLGRALSRPATHAFAAAAVRPIRCAAPADPAQRRSVALLQSTYTTLTLTPPLHSRAPCASPKHTDCKTHRHTVHE